MIKPSIRNKVLLLVFNALILLVVLAGIVTWQFNRINANKETISLNSNALGDQMEADMMHDALRADVLSALHAAASKDENSSTEVSRQFVEHARRFRAGIKANEERTLDQAITAALASVDKPLEEYIQTAESLVTIAATNGVAAEAQWPAFKDAFSRLEEKMENVSEVIKAGGNAANKASNALVTQFRLTVAISLALAVLSLSVLAWYITRGIVNALDDVGQKLKQGAGQLALSANEVSGASQSLAEGASEQAASLEETSASLEEISSMTKRNSEHAANAATLGRQSRDSAAAGIERINELSLTLNSIKAAVSEMQTAVSEMQSSSQQVSKIIKTIDEIAFQTNLLALNAAVEAARAGEAGMGFAVVADEVRALAQRSAQAAKDTSEKIEAAVKRSELGVVASSKVVRSLGEVEVTAQSIQQVFTGIASQIKSLDDVIAEIAAASKEQSQGVGEVNMAVGQMDKVTQSNAAAAEENAGAANELDGQARTLQDVVARLEAVVSGRLQQDSPAAHRDDNPPKQTGKPRFQAAPKRTVIATSVNRSNARSPAPSATKVPNDRDIPMPEPDGANNNIDAFKDF